MLGNLSEVFRSDSPASWANYLVFAEWWFNTTFHSSIHTTPYEALYGQPPPQHLPYMAGDFEFQEVDRSLVARELQLQLLNYHLRRAQQRMVSQANKHRYDRESGWEIGFILKSSLTGISHCPTTIFTSCPRGTMDLI